MTTASPSPSESRRRSAAGTLTLILGGVRSGKSDFGHALAEKLAGDDVLFVATAEAGDEEMRRRIAEHRRVRPEGWRTLEATTGVAAAIDAWEGRPGAVLLDCLTLLVSNIVCARADAIDALGTTARLEEEVLREVDALAEAVGRRSPHLIVVSGEVGQGIVPESRLGRVFRDLLGMANRRLSRHATATFLLVAGHAVPLHAMATGHPQAAALLRQAIHGGTP